MGLDERHYNITTLNKLFALSALLLLGTVGFLFFNDYSRKWKDYQNDFQNMEIEKTRVKYDGEMVRLNADPEYKKLQDDLKKAHDAYSTQCSPEKLKSATQAKNDLTAKSDIIKQQYRVTKAQFDAAKFHYEEDAANEHKDVKAAESHYQKLDQKTKELKLSSEKTDADLAVANKAIDDCGMALKEIERKDRALTKKAAILSRKLKKIDPNEMSLTNRVANLVRNLPVVDLANPTVKINQVVLKDIREDLNFLTMPKVDRCTTCHLGIANPDYKDAQQPLRTHPNLELYVSKDSKHPIEEFGCTVCHEGNGRATNFTGAAHTPSSPAQAKEWEEKYGWEKLHHWDRPMFSSPTVQASCFKCHAGQTTIAGAEKLNLGMNLIERAGCYACHNIDKYKEWPKPGPSLIHIASKTTSEWSYLWISDPKSFRHATWMPSYFGQPNNSDPASAARSRQEVHAIVHYLFSQSEDYQFKPLPTAGDVKKGEEIVSSVGCFGCHVFDPGNSRPVRDRAILKREQGPNLIGLGTKTSPAWIYDWLKDPQRYHPGSRMPDLRLSDPEAADVAAFLSQDKNSAFDKKSIPPVDEKVLNEIVLGFLKKTLTQSEAQEKLAKMSLKDKMAFSGKKLIAQYGCFSCHDIKGFEGYKPIGTDLNEEGSKTTDKFDFGFVQIDHSKEAWINQKIRNPRIFDIKKIKASDEKLVMPNFNFTQEETEAIATAVLGLVKEKPGKIKPRTPENIALERGEQIVREFNCQGCHIIEGEGGAIKDSVNDWLIKYQGKEKAEAENIVKTFSPPTLKGIGAKTQTQWLFEFIHQPEIVRPWLKVRMPTYKFNASHLNALVKYFNVMDKEEFPFTEHVNTALSPEETVAAQKMFSTEYFDCMKCHVVGDRLPSGTQDTWAPNLALVGKRLKPDWLIRWIKNPSAIDPTTKMPTFFDPSNYAESGPPDILSGDEDEQIRVLRNYVMSLSTLPLPSKATPEVPAILPAVEATAPESTPTSMPSNQTEEPQK